MIVTPKEVAKAIGGASRQGDAWTCFCPIHEADGRSHNPSLAIGEGQQRDIVATCRAGCPQTKVHKAIDAIIARLEAGEDIEPVSGEAVVRRSSSNHERIKKEGKPVAAYVYKDADGGYVATKIRYEALLGGKKEKTFIWWNQSSKGTPLEFQKPSSDAFPLYNLPAVTAATDDEVVIVVEGEKDVDNLAKIGFVATTAHNGVSGAREPYVTWLSGKHVVLLADNDEVGKRYIQGIAAALADVSKSVRIVLLPGLKAKQDVSDWIEAGGNKNKLWNLIEATQPEAADKADPNWRLRLESDAKESIRQNDCNLITALRWAPEFHAKFALDTFSQKITVQHPLPGEIAKAHKFPRALEDVDEVRILEWMQKDAFHSLSRSKVPGAVQLVANERAFDPLKDYINGLEWDGNKRLDTWLQDYAGAEGNVEYLTAVGRMWAISAVARTLAPGCQADHMLVLEGPQGLYKSTLLRTLAPKDDWFTDDVQSMSGDKDDKMALHGRWIVEVKELEALKKAEIGAIKKFIDTREDKLRPPYGRVVRDFPRRCVLAGTYNPTGHGWIKDASGGRRFWPVSIVKPADIEGVKAIRDQLWAEAKVAYLAGEKWWSQGARLQEILKKEQDARYQSDPLEDLVHSYITHDCDADDRNGPLNLEREWSARPAPLEIMFPQYFCRDVLRKTLDALPVVERNKIGQAMLRLEWTYGSYYDKLSKRQKKGWRKSPSGRFPDSPQTSPKNLTCRERDEISGQGKYSGSETNTKSACQIGEVRGKGEGEGEAESRASSTKSSCLPHPSLDFSLGGINKNIGGVYIPHRVFEPSGEVVLSDLPSATAAISSALADGACALDLETTGLTPGHPGSRVRLLQIYRAGHAVVVDCDAIGGLSSLADVLRGGRFIAFNGLFEMSWFRDAGIDVVVEDLKLAWAAVYGGGANLAHVVKALIGVDLDKSLQKSDWSGDLTDEQVRYALDDAKYTYLAWKRLDEIMSDAQVVGYKLLRDAQRPVCRMIEAGVAFDLETHRGVYQAFERKMNWASAWLVRHVPEVANWGSGLQVAAWLSEVLPPALKRRWPRTEKTGALKTGAEICARFACEVDPKLRRIFWAIQILSASKKIVSTYGESLLKHVDGGRLRGRFTIAQAVTGRMSSSAPNLQNMPSRGRKGATFRRLFVAPEGRKLVVADYSQVEVRVGGLLADEPVLAKMFADGYDVHRATAAKMFGVDAKDVTKPQRSSAKAVTFGMQYGMGEKSLALKLRISLTEARKLTRQWEETFPKVAAWRENSAKSGRKAKGLVLHSGRTITLAYRPSPQVCYNYPVQGTAGDVMYAALAELDRRLDESGLDAFPILVIHDEVVLEASEKDADAAAHLLEEAMAAGFEKLFPGGATPGLVSASVCGDWGAA